MNKIFILFLSAIFSSAANSSGIPTFDPARSKVFSEMLIPLESGNLFRLRNDKCYFAGRTTIDSDRHYLDIRTAKCGQFSISLKSKLVEYNHPIVSGDVVLIPVGLLDFISDQIKEAENK